MKRNSNSQWLVAAALVALTAPVVCLNAQGGGGGRGGGKGAPVTNVPAPTSPVTGNAVSWKGAVLLLRLLRVPRLQRRDRSAGFRRTLGKPGDRADFPYVPARPRERRAGYSVDVHAEFRRGISVRQAGEGYLRLHPDVQKHGAADLKDTPTLNAIVDAAKQDKK